MDLLSKTPCAQNLPNVNPFCLKESSGDPGHPLDCRDISKFGEDW